MISVAVVGIGRMGGKHASNFCKGAVKNAKLVAVCDIDGKVLEAFKNSKGWFRLSLRTLRPITPS